MIMVNPLTYFREEWETFWYKYSDERVELARHRQRVHKLNLEGKCQFNPYTEPDTDWYKY